MTKLDIDRGPTAHTELALETHAPGERDMPIDKTIPGNDVPITATFTDPDTGDATDPDDTDSSGDPNASITIESGDGSTTHINSVDMTYNSTGEFEYVWDTETDADGGGEYTIEVSAELSTETKLARETITLEA